MTVKFNIVERGNPTDREAPKKFYPSIQASGRITTRELAESASQMSTLTTTDMMAALESLLTIIPEELAKGNIVELGDFGTFWLRATSDGAATADDVRPHRSTTCCRASTPARSSNASWMPSSSTRTNTSLHNPSKTGTRRMAVPVCFLHRMRNESVHVAQHVLTRSQNVLNLASPSLSVLV